MTNIIQPTQSVKTISVQFPNLGNVQKIGNDGKLASIPQVDPDPTPARTKAYQPNALKTQTSVKVRTQPQHRNLLESAALQYAAAGLYVVPLHEPLFDSAGNVTGCTCEAYKRSKKYFEWLRSKGQEKRFNPNFKCPEKTRGKHPRLSDWEAKASTDPAQISAWWQKWPNANVGIAVGKSGLITFDLDTYKEVYGDDSDLFTQADKQTVTQISGAGGEHLVYKMPAGKAYGNAKGTLPPGVDIRGIGGMQVVWPSIHPTGRRYEWEEGYSIFDLAPRPLPQALEAILDQAHEQSVKAQAVTFTEATTERPELIRWRLSKAIRELINAPGSGDRSKNDMKAITALCYAGASDDDILAVFQHYPIGANGKFAEAGPVYLAHTIGKARAWVDAHPRIAVGATIERLRLWNRTHSFAAYIDPQFLASDGTYRTDSTDTRVVAAVYDEMLENGRLSVNIGKKRLGKRAGVNCNTAWKALSRLNGWLFTVTSDPLHGALVALCDPSRLQQIDPSLWGCIVYMRDQSSENDERIPDEYGPRKADEPFLSGTSKLMRERIKLAAQKLEITPAKAKADYTFAALGESGLRVIDAMIRAGDMTAQELADETGKKISGIRTALRRLEQHGIVEAEREGAHGPKVYSLAPDVWSRVDELAPNLRTYTSAARRENKRLEAAQQFAKHGALVAKTPEEKQRLERRYAKLAKERLPHLTRLYPGLSPADVERLAFEVAAYKRSPETADAIRKARAEAQADHRNDVRMIRELAADIADVETSEDAIYTAIMQFGTFDAGTVRSVLQSKKQMASYETLADVRKRVAHEDLIAALHQPTPAPMATQPALIGGAQ